MKREREIAQPFDFAFGLMFEEYPEEFLKAIKAPGKYVRKANTHVKLPNGKTGEMDAAYIADPDGEIIFERTIMILEHQRQPVGGKKNFMITNYVIQGVGDEKLPFYVLIASHIDANKHQQEFKRNDSFNVCLQFLDLGERDNWERLNNTRNKIRFNKNLSVQDSLNLGIIVLFPPEDCAKERTREALHYFMELKITSKRLEYVLYSVYYCMIDAYFDEEEKYQKVRNMLEQKVSQETREKFASEIRRENRLMQVSAERDEALAKNSEISAERDEAFAFIRLILSEIEDVDDENIKEKISPYRNILKKCNV